MYTVIIYTHSGYNLAPQKLTGLDRETAFMYGEFYSELTSCAGVTVYKDGESPIFFR